MIEEYSYNNVFYNYSRSKIRKEHKCIFTRFSNVIVILYDNKRIRYFPIFPNVIWYLYLFIKLNLYILPFVVICFTRKNKLAFK